FFQKHNIPKDYNISMHYIPKERSGVCWVLLNIYPLEQSLRELARVFGAISSNKDNIMIFITMLQNLRFKFDHEELEATMQVFKCHYRAVKWPSGQYFDYIRDILNSAAQGEGGFRCVPPPCPAPTTPGKKHAPTHSIDSAPTYSIHKSLPHRACRCLSQEVKHRTMNRLGQGGVCCPCFRSQSQPIKSRRGGSPESNLERGHRRLSTDVERTITIPIPPVTSPTDTPIMGEA
uniref:Kit ligand n=1 Tax=Oncorhynchus kisutch TaxID=8019 RepID=A0A8C7M4E4_ONCKI